MSLSIDQFEEFFRELHKDKGGSPVIPFPWQSRLARHVFKNGWPSVIDLPTASGKTSAIDIAVFVLACQANSAPAERHVGRRIFFTVNRRVIVFEAYIRAKALGKALLDAPSGILKEVADALRRLSGDEDAPPLDVVQLRGGIYRDRAWARSITQPIVVCTTADQLGSRLLFRGYGVSESMQPIHAALTACDSLILLDEAHVTRAFSQTLGLLTRYRQLDTTSPPMRFVEMTATPANPIPADKRFSLKDENWSDPRNAILKKRQAASKPAKLVPTGKKTIVDEIVKRAVATVVGEPRAVGIIVNRVKTAREIYQKLFDTYGSDVHLVIGRMRPLDRNVLEAGLRNVVGPDRPDILPKPCFVVATQCLEVGADYDFDVLITECASIDALRQRFGRLNRKGREIAVEAVIITNDAAMRDEDPVYGNALKNTWDWLVEDGRSEIDFGILAFKTLWDEMVEDRRQMMLAPAADAAILLPAHLDALSQTAPAPEPSPDVSLFIHGPQSDNAEVNVCWRADLETKMEDKWDKIVALLPPTSPECMTVPLHAVRSWMLGQESNVDADVPIRQEDNGAQGTRGRPVVIWRGARQSKVSNEPKEIRPGDTVVIPASAVDSLVLGYIPPGASPDIAEEAFAEARRQRVVRVHASVHNDLPTELRDYAMNDDKDLPKHTIRDLLADKADGFRSGPDEIPYPKNEEGRPIGLLLRFKTLADDDPLRPPVLNPLRPPVLEDDGDDAPSETGEQVLLAEHTQHVVDRVARTLDTLRMDAWKALFKKAAELHDIGKADVRFQALLAGVTPYEAMNYQMLLAKSGELNLTREERDLRRARSELPAGFRHEMLSVEAISNLQMVPPGYPRADLLLHLIAAHHGYARPFAPVVLDSLHDERGSFICGDELIDSATRFSWTPAHQLDSGVAERFWKLTSEHTWWGLAWLESVLRLADQQASASEQKGRN